MKEYRAAIEVMATGGIHCFGPTTDSRANALRVAKNMTPMAFRLDRKSRAVVQTFSERMDKWVVCDDASIEYEAYRAHMDSPKVRGLMSMLGRLNDSMNDMFTEAARASR